MGIRTPHRRTAPAPAQANADQPPSPAQPPVPAVATDASTARIPVDLLSTLRQTATTLRRRLAHRIQGWAELTRGYLALARTLLPRRRPAAAVTEPPDGSAPDRPRPHPHPHPHCQGPRPDATP
ncbi:hypothetical protein ABIE67_002597 [Streptomyces sp. V4I8]|uniref:hypothetical protein n=1 Tax=Streptomyces sp. V4I8 TaxID=3156469 RepID=UPI0035194760